MKNKPYQYLLLILFSSICYSQTVIKEKVKITSGEIYKIRNSNVTVTSNCSVSLEFNWDKSDFEASICSYYSGGTYCTNSIKGGSIETTVIDDALNHVSFRVALNLEENVESNFNYRVRVNGVAIQNGYGKAKGRWLSPVYIYIGPLFDEPYRPEIFNNFRTYLQYSIGSSRLCYKKPVDISIFTNIDCEGEFNITKNSLAKVKIEPPIKGVELYEYGTKNKMGTEVTKTLQEIWDLGYQIIIDENYYSTKDETLYVTTEIEGRVRKDSIIIGASQYGINTENTGIDIMERDSVIINVYSESDNECSPPELPEFIKYNIRIVEGEEYGMLKDLSQERYGRELENISHNKGSINFLFIADTTKSLDERTVIIEVTTTSENIEPLYIEVRIIPNRILVEFASSTIGAGDTSLINLKYRDKNGNIVEFEEGERFLVRTNTEYGYFLYVDEVTGEEIPQNEILYEKLPIKFVALEDIPYPYIKTEIRVITYLGDEVLCGKGSIKIRNRKVNAYFEKEPKMGDTIEVKVNLIDSEGNIKELPDTTHFEVGIKEGCGIGKILTADGREGDYFFRIPKPIRFIVNDSIKVDSSKVVIRVGIAKKPKVEEPPILIGKVVGKGNKSKKERTVKNTEDYYCSVSEYVYERYGLAEGVLKKKDCSTAPQCEGEVEPKINIIKIEESHCNDNPIVDGVTVFYINRFEEEFDLSACYNSQLDKWQFEIITPLKYSSEVCYREGRVYLRDTSDLRRLSIDELCNAEVDIANFESAQHTVYKIEEIIRRHEELHVEQNKMMFSKALEETKFYERFKEYKISCDEINDENIARLTALKDNKPMLLEFIESFKQKKKETEGNPYSEDIEEIQRYIDNERDINDKLKGIREKYFEVIKKITKCF